MALPAAKWLRVVPGASVETRPARRPLRSCQLRAGSIVTRFLLTASVWVLASGTTLQALPRGGTAVKLGADLAFLAFAAHYLHSKVLGALSVAESADQAYRDASIELIERLATVGEYRDDLTGGHARRIGRYASILGRRLGLSHEECERLELAASIHDIGKVGIPDAILNKADVLTPEERTEMQTHVEIGARMLEGGSHPLVRIAHTVALTHHENWDGTGYPQGLKGEEIPLVGRIVALCDVYDALSSTRPYKRAWCPKEVIAEIRRLSGTKFDPVVVEAFLSGQFELRASSDSGSRLVKRG